MISYNPQIVTSGLKFYLDASNRRSYPGSGNTWTDLIQGIPMGAAGTPIFQTTGSLPCFTMNGTNYFTSSASDSALVDLRGNYTLIIWLYSRPLPVRKTLFEKAGTIQASYRQELAVTLEPTNGITYFRGWTGNAVEPSYDSGTGQVFGSNAWVQIAVRGTTHVRAGATSNNGEDWYTSYVQRSTGSLIQAGEVRVGYGYAGAVDSGSIARVMVYDRVLDGHEIYKNYSALRKLT